MGTVRDVLRVARAEIGYNRWTDEAEGTKYGRWYAAQIGNPYYGSSGVPYCNMFVSWVLAHAGVSQPRPGLFAYVPYCIDAYRKAGLAQRFSDAAAGDLICYDWDGDGEADHIGIVEANRGTHLQTIEGNTAPDWSGSQDNGGKVCRRTRNFGAVIAILRPAYASNSSPKHAVKELKIKPKKNTKMEGQKMIKGYRYDPDPHTVKYGLFDSESGWCCEFSNGEGRGPLSADYINSIARYWGTGSWPTISPGHAQVIRDTLEAVRG